MTRRSVWFFIAIALSYGIVPAQASVFHDPLDTAAERVLSPQNQPILATAKSAAGLVAVGMRGLIIISMDGGANWQQVPSPVQSDLTAVRFPVPQQGWAVGHDGVILHSADGGRSWQRQLDGRIAAKTFTANYRSRIEHGEQTLAPLLADVERNYQAGPSLPWLDVYFADARNGFVVGSFGSIARTDDGGQTWRPALDQIDNPDLLNLNAITEIDHDILIAGERGTVFRLDRTSGKFVAIATPYAGSYFGISGGAGTVYVYGLRGTIYRSSDRGNSWQAISTPAPVTVTGACTLNDGEPLFVTLGGMAWLAKAGAASLSMLELDRPDAYTSVTAIDTRHVLLSGLGGVHVQTLPQKK